MMCGGYRKYYIHTRRLHHLILFGEFMAGRPQIINFHLIFGNYLILDMKHGYSKERTNGKKKDFSFLYLIAFLR